MKPRCLRCSTATKSHRAWSCPTGRATNNACAPRDRKTARPTTPPAALRRALVRRVAVRVAAQAARVARGVAATAARGAAGDVSAVTRLAPPQDIHPHFLLFMERHHEPPHDHPYLRHLSGLPGACRVRRWNR